MLKDGEPPFSPETNGSSNVPQEIQVRGRERSFNLLRELLVISLLTGAGMFGVLTGSRIIADGKILFEPEALKGFFDLSAAVGITGGAVWIIEPLPGRLAHRLVEHFSQR